MWKLFKSSKVSQSPNGNEGLGGLQNELGREIDNLRREIDNSRLLLEQEKKKRLKTERSLFQISRIVHPIAPPIRRRRGLPSRPGSGPSNNDDERESLIANPIETDSSDSSDSSNDLREKKSMSNLRFWLLLFSFIAFLFIVTKILWSVLFESAAFVREVTKNDVEEAISFPISIELNSFLNDSHSSNMSSSVFVHRSVTRKTSRFESWVVAGFVMAVTESICLCCGALVGFAIAYCWYINAVKERVAEEKKFSGGKWCPEFSPCEQSPIGISQCITEYCEDFCLTMKSFSKCSVRCCEDFCRCLTRLN